MSAERVEFVKRVCAGILGALPVDKTKDRETRRGERRRLRRRNNPRSAKFHEAENQLASIVKVFFRRDCDSGAKIHADRIAQRELETNVAQAQAKPQAAGLGTRFLERPVTIFLSLPKRPSLAATGKCRESASLPMRVQWAVAVMHEPIEHGVGDGGGAGPGRASATKAASSTTGATASASTAMPPAMCMRVPGSAISPPARLRR